MPTVTASRSLPFASGFSTSVPGRIVFALAATVVVALAAHVSVPLWFTPVPLTLQPLAVLGVGLALGPLDGMLAMLAYLAEGAAGLPVFSPAGVGGVAQLLGPSGGFLMAYPLVAAIAGGLTRKLQMGVSRFAAALGGCTLAVLFLFTAGALWFHTLQPLAWSTVVAMTVLPFLPGEAVKVLAAAGIYSTLSRARRA